MLNRLDDLIRRYCELHNRPLPDFLLEEENITANKGGTATLSTVDKEAHNTREELPGKPFSLERYAYDMIVTQTFFHNDQRKRDERVYQNSEGEEYILISQVRRLLGWRMSLTKKQSNELIRQLCKNYPLKLTRQGLFLEELK